MGGRRGGRFFWRRWQGGDPMAWVAHLKKNGSFLKEQRPCISASWTGAIPHYPLKRLPIFPDLTPKLTVL